MPCVSGLFFLRRQPPKVEYALSGLGKELRVHMIALWTWRVENAEGFRRSRQPFDRDQDNQSSACTTSIPIC